MSWSPVLPADGIIEKLDQILYVLKSSEKDEKIPELITLDQAAGILKCPLRTIRYYIHEEKSLPYLKVGREIRFRKTDLSSFIKSRLINHSQID